MISLNYKTKPMKRSTFLKQSGALATLSLLPTACFNSSRDRFPMGLQLYSVRDFMAKDPVGTLKKLKAMGYTDFETYGYDTENMSYYGFKAADFKQILTDLELSTYSGHYGVHGLMEATAIEVERYVDRCIEGALALGDAFITWPKLDAAYHSEAGYQLLVSQLNTIGKQVSAAGLKFAYHNFGYDFNTYGNKMGIDWVLEETNPDYVQLEADFYWVMHAGVVTPKQLIEKAAGRVPLWHIKDMDKLSRDYTELGNGSIDYTRLLPSAKTAGLERYYIEQGGNFAVNSLQSVADSARYFKKNLREKF